MSNAIKKTVTVTRNATQNAADVIAPLSGQPAKVERFASALSPLLSIYIVSGGNKVELTAPDRLSVNQKHSPAAKQLWACKGQGKKAFALLITHAESAGFKVCPNDQAKHDLIVENFEVAIAAVFVQPVKTKDTSKETPTQTIARLTAEIFTLKIERDALKSIINGQPVVDTVALI